MEEIWTVKKILDWAIGDFGEKGMDSPRLEAELLLSSVLNCDRISLYTEFDRPLEGGELESFRGFVIRRRKGEPAAYILEHKEFWSLDLKVSKEVLVPRPDTETLVQAALDLVGDSVCRVLDLGTGSGCVAIAMAKERERLEIDAVDISTGTCEIARQNVSRHGLDDRVRVYEGDLFTALPKGERYGMIVTNPPYVIDVEIDELEQEVRLEPRIALAGGEDGLDVVRRILDGAPRYLEPGGWLLVEIDPRQAATVALEIGPTKLGVEGRIVQDLAGRDRVVIFQSK